MTIEKDFSTGDRRIRVMVSLGPPRKKLACTMNDVEDARFYHTLRTAGRRASPRGVGDYCITDDENMNLAVYALYSRRRRNRP